MKHGIKGELVLSIYPGSQGFAYILFEGPLSPYDWGNKLSNGSAQDKNGDVVNAVKKLIDRHRPEALVLPDVHEKGANRSVRIRKLHKALVHLAETEYVEVFAYPKHVVLKCFENAGVSNKYDLAVTIAREIPAFENQVPKRRKGWMSEDRRQYLFDAAALGIAHYASRS